MKKWFFNLFTFHFIPVFLGLLFTFCVLFYFDQSLTSKSSKIQCIKGKQLMFRGTNANCAENIQQEIELAASLKNQHSITIFGSSELGPLTYSPYFFLPDSLHIPTVAFGHAHHQSFAMFCELLAMQEQLKGTKICILVSPGWFETEGTNIEAFLEFVRPNFMKAIIKNDRIPLKYKMEIGRYITSNMSLIEEPNNSIEYFNNLYSSKNPAVVKSVLNKLNSRSEEVNYSVTVNNKKQVIPIEYTWENTENRIQKSFISSVKSNKFFISDEYYKTYLLDKNGKYKHGKTDLFDVSTNRELADFKLLVDLLKRYKCNASFVIQPLNPYHYDDLENYDEIIRAVEQEIKANDFPCYSMFVTKKQEYEPGTLTDVMHLGDYGWMKVNEFLVKTYYPKSY